MAPTKRPAASDARAAAPPTKKAAKKAAQDPARGQLAAIERAISQAEGYPSKVLDMLGSSLSASLLVCSDARHEFQTQVVDTVGEVLDSVRAATEKAREDITGKISASDTERATREALVATTTEDAAQRKDAIDAARVALAEASNAVGSANAALSSAKAEQRSGEATFVLAGDRKRALEATLEGPYRALKGGDSADVAADTKKLLKCCKDFDVEAQLLDSAQLALAKAPQERGSFEGLVLEQLEEQLNSRVTAFAEQIRSGEALRSGLGAATRAAEEQLAAASEKQAAVKGAFAAAQDAVKEAEATKKAAEKSLKDLAPELNQLAWDLVQVDAKLNAINEAVASYMKLKERTTVSMVEAAELPIEEVVEEAADMAAVAEEVPAS